MNIRFTSWALVAHLALCGLIAPAARADKMQYPTATPPPTPDPTPTQPPCGGSYEGNYHCFEAACLTCPSGQQICTRWQDNDGNTYVGPGCDGVVRWVCLESDASGCCTSWTILDKTGRPGTIYKTTCDPYPTPTPTATPPPTPSRTPAPTPSHEPPPPPTPTWPPTPTAPLPTPTPCPQDWCRNEDGGCDPPSWPKQQPGANAVCVEWSTALPDGTRYCVKWTLSVPVPIPIIGGTTEYTTTIKYDCEKGWTSETKVVKVS